MRRIAPPSLLGREEELAELARFCLEPGLGPYAWWQGDAWAGKSALLSTFVLNPPTAVRERTEIVSFFITGRLASQDTRDTFTIELLLQLAALTGQALPEGTFTEGIREGHLLDLLAQAARAYQESGKRLVLVVDGLDEDQSVTGSAHAHSIAALLPADPPSGMRVIVAGRPNPPIPDDVPGWHPLRDLAIVRPLLPSEHARDIQTLSERELTRLLDGSLTEQDLLGMLVAARGGLSHRDLEELTGARSREIKKILNTVAGRTFTRRASLLAPGTGQDIYLLGHAELLSTASSELREDLPSYRGQLHKWAADYREKGWPSETPEYLLTGYFQLLVSLGDLPRMITLASDQGRHDRMLCTSSADSTALAEIRITLERIAAQDTPDLAGALTLAIRRDNLSSRNTAIPANLPAVWAALGHAARAEALAYSVTEPDSRASALAGVARVLARAGGGQQASALAKAAETQTALISDQRSRSHQMTQTARALAEAGQHRYAESVARSIEDVNEQAKALTHVAVALARSGHRHAADLASEGISFLADEDISGLEPLAERVKAEIAWTLGGAGLDRLAEIIEDGISNPEWQPEAPARLAAALARAGHYERAESAALSVADSYWQARALAEITKSLAEAGNREHAEAVARSIARPPHWRVEALTHVIRAWGRGGEQQRAVVLADEATAAARSIISRHEQASILTQISAVLAGVGEHGRAAALATEAEKQLTRADPQALAHIAGVLAEAGERRHATRLAERAEAMARSGSKSRWKTPDSIAETLAEIRHQDAEAVAYSIPRPRTRALCKVARTLSQAGEHHRAAVVAASAEAQVGGESEELAHTAAAFAYAGEYEHAEGLVPSVKQPRDQVLALTQISEALSKAGKRQRAIAVAGRAARIAHQMETGYGSAIAWARVAVALARAGNLHDAVAYAATRSEAASRKLDYLPQLEILAETLGTAGAHQQVTAIADHAEELTRTNHNPAMMASLACGLAKAGAHQHATTVANRAEELTRTFAEPREQARLMMYVIPALAELGRYQRAGEVARSISALHGQATAFAEIALALARDGSPQFAEAAADLISRPDLPSARELALISDALLKAGITNLARRAAAVTCATGPWPIAARPVLLLDPSAAEVVVDALIQKSRSGADP